jgi:glycosyltransferase involved in cell wall biosynthesis/GT2 family glycosyltransferase
MIDPRTPNFASTPVADDRARFDYVPAPSDPALAPAATILTPFYNTGPVFHETARCVLGQSLQQFEWIIVNDCSNDPAALSVLGQYRELARRDPRIRIIDHKVNHGLSAARNTGFREARSPYVFMLDSDDLIEPTTVEKCAWFLECNPTFSFVKGKTVGFAGQEYIWERGFHDGPEILEQNIVTATTMVRTGVHREVGGFDETIRGGLEDWEFWLRCASRGLWGGTIPEYLEWYRRRAEPTGAWANLACSDRHEQFQAQMRRKFPRLFAGEFPSIEREWHMPHADVPGDIPWPNPLAKTKPRALMIVPWFRMGGADKFNLDSARMLREQGYELTIATTLAGHPWAPEFTRITPDVFMLDHLAQMPHYPRLLRYLIDSRRPDVVFISNSELAYLILPYLRAHCPAPVYIDYSHMEEEYWKNGGHPRHGAGMQDQLDLNIVSSDHLKRWMTARGGDPSRIEVCRTNVDIHAWKPDPELRRRTRDELGLADDVTAILYPVRLTAQKQPMVFADSIRRLRDRLRGTDDKFVAIIAGDGEDRPALERYIRQHKLQSHIRLLGAVAIARMPGMYNAADILFLPSMQEGIALSLYEAMACGKVVVGATVGGQAELVVDGAGFLFPLLDDKAAEADRYGTVLAELVQNPARRDQIGAAARRHVEANHPLEAMGRRLAELFQLAAHHKRTRPRQSVSLGLAQELAVAGIDWIRTRDLCEYLWPFRQRTLDAEAEQRRRAERERTAAAQAVGFIESSASWKLIQAARRLALRGPDTSNPPDPVARLNHIRASTSYKIITVVKRLPPLSVISRLRHGPDYRQGMPEAIRED